MKKTTIAILIFLLLITNIAISSENIKINYKNDYEYTLTIDIGKIDIKEIHNDNEKILYYDFFDGSKFVEYDKFVINKIMLPIALLNSQKPIVTYQIIETKSIDDPRITDELLPTENNILKIDDATKFRSVNFSYLTINPVLSNKTYISKIKLNIKIDNQATAIQTTKEDVEKISDVFINKKVLDKIKYSEIDKLEKKTTTTYESGQWLEIEITEKGIYKITGNDIFDAGIPEGNYDSDKIKIYSSQTFGRPYTLTIPDTLKNLVEIPMLFIDGSNNDNDVFLFYATGSSGWEFNDNSSYTNIRYEKNPYETVNHFWLLVPTNSSPANGLRMNQFDNSAQTGYTEIEHYWKRIRSEEDKSNEFEGGIHWYGNSFLGATSSQSYSFSFADKYIASGLNCFFRFATAGATKGSHSFDFSLNNNNISNTSLTNWYRRITTKSIDTDILSDNSELMIDYSSGAENTKGYLDYIDIIYPAKFTADDNFLNIWLQPENENLFFTVSEFQTFPLYIFNISNPFETKYFAENSSSFSIYQTASNLGSEYIILDESQFQKPSSIKLSDTFEPNDAENYTEQIDFIIITPEIFEDEAERLATFKRNRIENPLNTKVITVDKIYDQYSGGNKDPYAIRNFLNKMYNECPAPKPYFVLLFGDATYDYRNISGDAKNFVPQFEKPESNGDYKALEGNYNSDDFFVKLDNNSTPDLAIGRLPVNSVEEAEYAVDKIITYENNSSPGLWQIRATIIGDDPARPFDNEPYHITDNENYIIPKLPKTSLLNKIYLTEYLEVPNEITGFTSREGVKEDIYSAFEDGTVIINYLGHGSPTVLTQEKVFVKEDIYKIEANSHFPLITAGTCSWSHSDKINFQSMGEEIMLLENNGAIATISPTRATYANNNVNFLRSFYSHLFPNSTTNSNNNPIGFAYLNAKISTSNNEKFILHGDPTIKLNFPNNSGEINYISSDTLKALDVVNFRGEVFEPDSTEFNAVDFDAIVNLFDNQRSVTREYKTLNGVTKYISYKLPGSKLFSGKISFTDNTFDNELIIPKDISYSGNNGILQIMYYNDDNSIEGTLYKNELIIQGYSDSVASDFSGPTISVSVSNNNIVSGDVVADSAIMQINFFDENGINITNSVGHAITLNIDDSETDINITDDFQYLSNSYQNGKIQFAVNKYFESGKHNFKIGVFDNVNNYNYFEVDIKIIEQNSTILDQIVNFPNPFRNETDFTFYSAYDGIGEIEIFTISGKPIYRMQNLDFQTGYNSFHWNGMDNYYNKLASGIYFYKIKLFANNKTFEEIEKLVILP
ncbi:MAG: type IX secretion system sortase PorU [Candidatus Marinimicrobia bacterium]|nr:type IX secretion system sortase PorU [Candidatus Neomarinimicrobiota bacterium]